MSLLAALVLLRWKLDLRALLGARERLAGLLLALPFGVLAAAAGAALAWFAVRALALAHPEALLGAASLGATLVGLFWALSPLISGVAFTESHDLTRLMHFPVRPRLLVVASFVANLTQPMVLGELPVTLALALALAGRSWRALPCVAGLLLSLVFIVAAAQAVSLLLHGVSRNRRLHDAALFAGLALSFLVSIGPFLLLAGAGRSLGALARALLGSALPSLSPFGWGARAAVHAGRGEWGAFAILSLLSLSATGSVLLLSGALAGRIYRGEVDAGRGPTRRGRRARGLLPGTLGALLEKDLRVMWREPALKAMLVIGLVGPLVFLFFLTRLQAGRPPAASLLVLASFVGLGGLGSNAFGLERRALSGLFAFPLPRWRILLAKNLAATIWRLPGLSTVALAGLLLAPAWMLPAALVVVASTLAIATGVDNFLSILFPVALPAPGRNPYGRGGVGGRGLVGIALNFAALVMVLLVSAPFVFLAWLPLLMGVPALGALSLPIGLAGALAVYAMLVAGAAGLLERREPELLERVLGEA